MVENEGSETAARRRSRAGAILSFIPALLVTIWLVVDDVIDALLNPVFHRFSTWSLVIWVQRWARSLRPYPALALLLVPAIIIEPAKLVGVYMIGEGHYVTGILILIAAFGAGVVFIERVFELNRDKILSIGWFRKCYGALTSMRDKLYNWAERTGFWMGFSQRFKRRRESRMPLTSSQR